MEYTCDESVGFIELYIRKFQIPHTLMENITAVFFTSDGSAEGQLVQFQFLVLISL